MPTGYKWRDGTKYHIKAGRWNDAETCYFLAIGNDMHIKYTFWGRNTMIRIEQFRELTANDALSANDVMQQLSSSPLFETAIRTEWKKYGLRQGYVEKILRDI